MVQLQWSNARQTGLLAAVNEEVLRTAIHDDLDWFKNI